MYTFKHILRNNHDAVVKQAKETYGFDAFYAWFIQTYSDQMTEYEQENMSRNIPVLKSLFEVNSDFHRTYHKAE